MLFERVKSIIEKKVNINGTEITPEASLIGELGINSLDLVELICAFEVEFDIVVPEKDIRKFSKVQDIVAYLEARQ